MNVKRIFTAFDNRRYGNSTLRSLKAIREWALKCWSIRKIKMVEDQYLIHGDWPLTDPIERKRMRNWHEMHIQILKVNLNILIVTIGSGWTKSLKKHPLDFNENDEKLRKQSNYSHWEREKTKLKAENKNR